MAGAPCSWHRATKAAESRAASGSACLGRRAARVAESRAQPRRAPPSQRRCPAPRKASQELARQCLAEPFLQAWIRVQAGPQGDGWAPRADRCGRRSALRPLCALARRLRVHWSGPRRGGPVARLESARPAATPRRSPDGALRAAAAIRGFRTASAMPTGEPKPPVRAQQRRVAPDWVGRRLMTWMTRRKNKIRVWKAVDRKAGGTSRWLIRTRWRGCRSRRRWQVR